MREFQIPGPRPDVPTRRSWVEPLHEPSKWRKQILWSCENPLDFFMALATHEICPEFFIERMA
ncbi:hypothetical protein [Mesorhizobium waimense]|uniref:hypothetical protein n=1 Tax=Mesorhizobium waimense TaxID=1300307 RepID=UPI00142E58C9|nr:hypothetical protein [Mesorhizobium waimense]